MGSDRTFGQLVADHLVSAVEADGTFVRIADPDILVNTPAYEYDLIDQPYGSEVGFHFHTEPNGRGPEIHRHKMVNGGKRERYSGPEEHTVPLDQALNAFRGQMWANRYPGSIAPTNP